MITIILPNRNEENIYNVISAIENEFPGCQVIISCDRDSRGKGWAVREALTYANGDIICFLDGDGDIEPRMIRRLIPFLDDYDIVLGTKPYPGRYSRRLLTWLSRRYIRFMFGLDFDTQTGIKLFKRYAIPQWRSNGFLFDVEILSKAKKQGFSMIEVPIMANVVKKMPLKSIIKTLLDSFRIWRALK